LSRDSLHEVFEGLTGTNLMGVRVVLVGGHLPVCNPKYGELPLRSTVTRGSLFRHALKSFRLGRSPCTLTQATFSAGRPRRTAAESSVIFVVDRSSDPSFWRPRRRDTPASPTLGVASTSRRRSFRVAKQARSSSFVSEESRTSSRRPFREA